jgi:hypothetical protein
MSRVTISSICADAVGDERLADPAAQGFEASSRKVDRCRDLFRPSGAGSQFESEL